MRTFDITRAVVPENKGGQQQRPGEIEINAHHQQQQIAVLGVRVESQIAGLLEKTTVEQSICNDEDQAIEVSCALPIPPGAAVTGFEVFTSDKVLTGKIDELESAVETYDKSIAAGESTFMPEPDHPELFSVNLGCLDAGQIAVLRVEYVRTLSIKNGAVQLTWPTTVAHRHISPSDQFDPHALFVDSEMINPPQFVSVPFGLSVEVTIDASLEIKSIKPRSHKMTIKPAHGASTDFGTASSCTTRLSLVNGRTSMDRDVNVVLEFAQFDIPRAIVEVNPNGNHYVGVTFMPDLKLLAAAEADTAEHTVGKQLQVVLDCAGSMTESEWNLAKAALMLTLQKLDKDDVFNIVCSPNCNLNDGNVNDGNAQPDKNLSDSLKQQASDETPWLPVTKGSLNSVMRLLQQLDHSRNITDLCDLLHMGLSRAAQQNVSAGRRSVIDLLLVTNALALNESDLIDLVKSSTQRVSVIGVGREASDSSLQELASHSQGACEIITDAFCLQEKIAAICARIKAPHLTNIELVSSVGTRLVMGCPQSQPLFDGDAICLVAELDGRPSSQWMLRAMLGSKPISWVVPIGNKRTATPLLCSHWARQRIRYLESCLSRQFRDNNGHAVKRLQQQVVELSHNFNMLCSKTAFVGLEHRTFDERNLGLPAQRRVSMTAPVQRKRRQFAEAEVRKIISAMVSEGRELKTLQTLLEPLKKPKIPKKAGRSDPGTKACQSSSLAADCIKATSTQDESPCSSGTYDLLLLQQSCGAFIVDRNNRHRYSDFVERGGVVLQSALKRSKYQHHKSLIAPTLYALFVLNSQHQKSRKYWYRAEKNARQFLARHGLGTKIIHNLIKVKPDQIRHQDKGQDTIASTQGRVAP